MMTTAMDRRSAFGDLSNSENILPVGDRKAKNAVGVSRQPPAESQKVSHVSMAVLLSVVMPHN